MDIPWSNLRLEPPLSKRRWRMPMLVGRYRSDDEDRDDGDEKTRIYVLDSIALCHRLPEPGTSLDSHTRQEEHQSYLSQHHVGGSCRVGDQLEVVAEADYEDGDDK